MASRSPDSAPAGDPVNRVLAAGAVITDEHGRLLLVLRGVEPQRGRWSVPGGAAEEGESLEQAAAREALEETGLIVSIGQELGTVTVPTSGGRVFEVHDFAATVVGGILSPGDDADEARWFSVDELDLVPLTVGLRGYLTRVGVLPAEQ